MTELFPSSDSGLNAIKLYQNNNMTKEEILECKKKTETEEKQIKEDIVNVESLRKRPLTKNYSTMERLCIWPIWGSELVDVTCWII